MKPLLASAAVLFALAAGFVAGSWWHAELSMEPPQGPAVTPIARPRTDCAPCSSLAAPTLPPPENDAGPCSALYAALESSRLELRNEVTRREEQRTQREGSPIPPATRPAEPRFEPQKLASAVSAAFTEARVPGRVDGADCTEWPCIVFGRIRGTEDAVEKLEEADALAAYQNDVLAVQLWVVTDEAASAGPLPLLPGRPEQSLFAFAWYPRGLERPLAENLDRRLRYRTNELWSTTSPSAETGR